MGLLVAAAPGTNRKGPPGVEQAVAQWHTNAAGMPYLAVRAYNATGGSLTKGGVYALTTSGASATTRNPQLATVGLSGGKRQTLVVALSAASNNSWADVCPWGYVEALVEGTTDVAADDALIAVSGQTYLKKDEGSGKNTVGEALEAQTSNSAVLTDVFFNGMEAALDTADIHHATISLTNAEIKALRATPKTLIAAPGAGRVIELLQAILILDAGTNALTESADNLDIRYASATVLATVEATGFIDQTTDQLIHAVVANDKLVTKANCENKAVELFNNGDGEFGGNAANDATMRVKVTYRIHDTGW